MFRMRIFYLILTCVCCTNLYLLFVLFKSQMGSNQLRTSHRSFVGGPEETRYVFHESCPCHRLGIDLSVLSESQFQEVATGETTAGPNMGSYVGSSMCNAYTTALGYGQKVVAYSFYEPTNSSR